MKISVKDYDDLTPLERTSILKLRFRDGMVGEYLEDAQYNMEFSPRLKPCTKIIIARTPKEVMGWGLYTPEADTWEKLCNCKRLKSYYLQLYVARKHRKKGVGSAIIKESIKRAKRLKHQLLVFPHDHASRTVFSKYKELKVHPAWA